MILAYVHGSWASSRWHRLIGDGILGSMSDVTQILSQIEQGDRIAAEQLLPLVYGIEEASCRQAGPKSGPDVAGDGFGA